MPRVSIGKSPERSGSRQMRRRRISPGRKLSAAGALRLRRVGAHSEGYDSKQQEGEGDVTADWQSLYQGRLALRPVRDTVEVRGRLRRAPLRSVAMTLSRLSLPI